MSDFPKIDEKFVAAVKRMEARSTGVCAWIIIDPAQPDKYGRVIITRAKGGGMVRAVGWLPGPAGGGRWLRHHGSAGGGGYDMATAAMGGARVFDKAAGEVIRLKDEGADWTYQVQACGYIVARAV